MGVFHRAPVTWQRGLDFLSGLEDITVSRSLLYTEYGSEKSV